MGCINNLPKIIGYLYINSNGFLDVDIKIKLVIHRVGINITDMADKN